MLFRKMLRDLRENKMAYLACIFVISIGIMVFCSMSMVIQDFERAIHNFYTNHNFADGFAYVQEMPLSELKRLENTGGIKKLQGRLIKDVRLYAPGSEKNIYLRMVSVFPDEKNPINGVHLIEGKSLNNNEKNLWLDARFFDTHQLNIGDSIELIIEGKIIPFTVMGKGQSPDFAYALRTAQDFYPSPESFGIAYVPYDVMTSLLNQKNTVNEITFTLQENASYEDVESRLETKLKTYGLQSIYPRDEQTSHLLLKSELDGLKSVADSIPFLFLLISSIILYIMIKRLTEQQRGQIGTLKAFGYSNFEILFHYASYALIIGFFGGLIGSLSGLLLTAPMLDIYNEFFNLPDLVPSFQLEYLIYGVLLTMLFSLIAGYEAARGILKLHPAEAMRPPAPPPGKNILIEKIRIFWSSLNTQGRMAARNISRNKGRSFFTFLGIMFTFSLMAFIGSFNRLIDLMIYDQFERIQTADLKISFSGPLSSEEVCRLLSRETGIKKVEPLLEVPARLKNNWHQKDLVILGLEKDSILYNIIDKKGHKIYPPDEGIILSESAAKALDVSVGSYINLESIWLEDKEDKVTVRVTGIIPQYFGVNAYMNQKKLSQILKEPPMATSALLSLDKKAIKSLKDKYNNSPIISSMEEKEKIIDKYNQMIGSYASMIWILGIFVILTGFAIVYNSSIISLSERTRELASLRVLGMTQKEVLEVISFEQWSIAFAGMLAGIPMAYAMMETISKSMSTDLFTIPSAIEPPALFTAFWGTTLSVFIAQISTSKKIKQLDLVNVLKELEI
ncbi:MAG TPA: FtsX-like permease family protein [Defluviitaleaceae bacterium]|nr:FtsX-like permease family protein [Defluviitaleaceae bacterium]